MTSASAARYRPVAVLLHWSIAALILTNLTLGLIAAYGAEDLHRTVLDPHKAIGILVLALSLVRLAWRLSHRPPLFPATMKAWETTLATLTHAAFYVCMIVIPVAGWWLSSAVPKRHDIVLLGLVELPFLPVTQSMASAGGAHTVHQYLAWLLIGLLALHVSAALKHQIFHRDHIFARMSLP